MSYEVSLRPAAQRELDDLPDQDYEVVAEAIQTLGEEPRPPRVKKLSGSDLWRIRMRQLRVVYAIDDKAHWVTIVRVARRREDTYRRL